MREFHLRPGDDDFKAGDQVLVGQFKPKDKVDVIGVSKGRGFAGVVKRHHFRGGEGSHGSMFHRARDRSGRPATHLEWFPGCAWGPHGPRARDRPESGNYRCGHPGQRVGGEGRGARSQRRIRGSPEGQEVTAMPIVDVVDLNNEKVGEVALADAVFGAEVNEALLYEAVNQYTAGLRAGTHKTKVRSEVAGSGKKLWKQKGTGRARVGSVRSPIWRHGGTAHGPQPRDYSYHLPRKMMLGALRSALSAKLRDGELKVCRLSVLPTTRPRTRWAPWPSWKPAARCWWWIMARTATWRWACAI